MKKYNAPALLVFGLIITMGGCSIGGEEVYPPPTAFFLVHASPDAPNVDIYSSGGLAAYDFAYGRDTGYFFTAPSTYTFEVVPTGTSTVVLSRLVPMDANRLYTVFIIDSLSKLKFAVVNDNFSDPVTDSALVRFLHFSPNAPYSDVKIYNSTDTLKYSGRSFNDQAADTTRFNFKRIKAGSYTLGLSVPGNTTNYAEFPGFNFSSGNIYTVYLRGFDGGAGAQALGAGLIRNTE